jgi:hypothetical protein
VWTEIVSAIVDASFSRRRQSTLLTLALDALRDGGVLPDGTVYDFLHDNFKLAPFCRCHKSVTDWDLEKQN